ncbi:hypothetical protein [Leptospira alstonii]|nr:hypothetical protein [Leptospira alstonii]
MICKIQNSKNQNGTLNRIVFDTFDVKGNDRIMEKKVPDRSQLIEIVS